MQVWIRRPQEREGKYLFSGNFFITQAVLENLCIGEIFAIYFDMQILVREKGGVDYLQVYENEAGDKLYFIDQCDSEMMTEESFNGEHNHCTLLFDYEY